MSELKIAVIPARGGSKRIPKKNIRMFAGKPMIAWSIEAGLSSGCFDQVVVSTDDDEIAAVARDFGADVPFVRPHDLSDDFTPTAPVIAHAIDWFARRGNTVDYACCIYATAPFIQAADIHAGLKLIIETSVNFVFPVTTFPYPIQRALRFTSQSNVAMLDPSFDLVRSQDTEETVHDAGQFYWGTSAAWNANKSILSSISAGVRVPRYRVQDIDSLEDLVRAEKMFRILLEDKLLVC